jgi:hypothetical protein
VANITDRSGVNCSVFAISLRSTPSLLKKEQRADLSEKPNERGGVHQVRRSFDGKDAFVLSLKSRTLSPPASAAIYEQDVLYAAMSRSDWLPFHPENWLLSAPASAAIHFILKIKTPLEAGSLELGPGVLLTIGPNFTGSFSLKLIQGKPPSTSSNHP